MTLGDLTGHTTGIARDSELSNALVPIHYEVSDIASLHPLSFTYDTKANQDKATVGDPQPKASPPGLPAPIIPSCLSPLNCSRKGMDKCQHSTLIPVSHPPAYFDTLLTHAPTFPTSSTPAYSNDAFQLLAWAFENITGNPFADLLQDKILSPLQLEHTTWSRPADADTVVPAAAAKVLWPVGAAEEVNGAYVFSPSIPSNKRTKGLPEQVECSLRSMTWPSSVVRF